MRKKPLRLEDVTNAEIVDLYEKAGNTQVLRADLLLRNFPANQIEARLNLLVKAGVLTTRDRPFAPIEHAIRQIEEGLVLVKSAVTKLRETHDKSEALKN